MADPILPKQLSEESPLVEFTVTGNVYVDPGYTAEGTPETSPITGEALVFGTNTLTNFTKNNNNSPDYGMIVPDEHAIFVSNLDRGTSRGNGHDYFFNYKRDGKALCDIYITNSKGGDFSASPRTADKYKADSDGTLNVYIEGSTFGGNLMGFGSQTDVTQTFTGNYEFTFKNSVTTWFCITYGTGYGLGENNPNNNRFGTVIGNIDLLVDGSRITDNGAVIRGAILPGGTDEKAYIRALFKDTVNQGNGGETRQFGIIMTGSSTTNFKSVADIDITVTGSTFGNFMVLPNASTSSAANDGSNALDGNISVKIDASTVNGLVFGAGRTGDNLDGRGWVRGDITFSFTGSRNAGVTSINKGKFSTEEKPGTVDGTIENSVLSGAFIGFQTGGTDNQMYANTTLRVINSTTADFSILSSYDDKYFGTANLEITASTVGNVATDVRGVAHSGGTFSLAFKAAETETSVGAISGQWSTITVDAGAKVRSTSIGGTGATLTIAVGSDVVTESISGVTTIKVTGEFPEGDLIAVSGLTIDALEDGTQVFFNDTEFLKGSFGGQYEITNNNLVLHNPANITFLVNSEYTDGSIYMGQKGYSTFAAAEAAVTDKAKTKILAFAGDEEHSSNVMTADVATADYLVSLEDVDFNNYNLVIGEAAGSDTINTTVARANNINKVTFGKINEGGTANVVISDSTINTITGFDGGYVADLSKGNSITNVYAEGFGSSLNLGNSSVNTYFAGSSESGKDIGDLVYEGALTAEQLVIGGNANKIAKIDATVTGGSVNELIVGNDGDTVAGDIDLNLNGGLFSTVSLNKATVGGDVNVTFGGGTVAVADDGTFYGLIYGASVTGALDGGDKVTVLGNAKVGSIVNFDSLEVKGGTLNVASGDTKSELSDSNALVINGDIVNHRGIQAGTITAKSLTNYGLVGTKRDLDTDAGIVLSGDLLNKNAYVKTSNLSVGGNFDNSGYITVVNDLSVSGAFTNSGNIYTLSIFDLDGKFTQKGGITLKNAALTNTGFISAGYLDGVTSLTTSKLYVTGGSEITGNITINAGAEVAITNKALEEGSERYEKFSKTALILGGNIEMAATSRLIVSGDFTATAAQSITVDVGSMIGANEILRAESGLNSWTINLTGANAGNYSLARTDSSVVIYSTDELFVNSTFSADKDNYVDGNLVAYGLNAFSSLAAAIAAYKDGSKIVVVNEKKGKTALDIAAAGYDIELRNSVVGAVNAEKITISGKTTVKEIFKSTGVSIGADSLLTIEETIPDGLSFEIDATAGSGSRKIVDVDKAKVTISEGQISVLKPLGNESYGSQIVDGDVYLTADKNVFCNPSLYDAVYEDQPVVDGEGNPVLDEGGNPTTQKVLVGYKAKDSFVNGQIDKATGDALFDGVNVFATEEEAVAAAKTANATLYLVGTTAKGKVIDGVNVIALEYTGGNSIYGSDVEGTFEGVANYTTKIAGSSTSASVYGLTKNVNVTGGDYNFVMSDTTSGNVFIVGSEHSNTMDGNVKAEITNSTTGITYIGRGNFGTDETKPIKIDVTISGSSMSEFHGINTQTDNTDPSNTQLINADINIKMYNSIVGGTFCVLDTNNDHYDDTSATQLQTYFSAGSINVEIAASTIGNNIRVGASLENGSKAMQAFNVSNTLHVVALDSVNTQSRAGYICEWDTIIVDANARLWIEDNRGWGGILQYSTVGKGKSNPLDGGGTLTQIKINMSGYESGTHNVIFCGHSNGQIYTDAQFSNITVIGDNDLTGQCQIAYGYNQDGDGNKVLKSIYVFDKSDDMWINTSFTSTNLTLATRDSQELLYSYNAFSDFGESDGGRSALAFASEWGGTIIVEGGQFETQDFKGNNAEIRSGVTFGNITLAGDKQAKSDVATLTIKEGAKVDNIDGSKSNTELSTLVVEGNNTLGAVSDFDIVTIESEANVGFKSLVGTSISIFADSNVTVGSLDLTGSAVVIDVEGYVGPSHAVISSEGIISGFDPADESSWSIIGEGAENYSVALTADKTAIVLKNNQDTDTYANTDYAINDPTGTIVDGVYLELGKNAFATLEGAKGGLGKDSTSYTLTVTGGEYEGDFQLSGYSFVMDGGSSLDGVVYGTDNKFRKGTSITIKEASTIGGISLTKDAYYVTKGKINLGTGTGTEAVTVGGSVIGGGDTQVTVDGKATVAGGIEKFAQLTITSNSLLAADYIDVNGGTIFVKSSGSSGAMEGNVRAIITTTTGISGLDAANLIGDSGVSVYQDGNNIYLLDLSRIYFNPGFTEEIDGVVYKGDTLKWNVNAFSNFPNAMAATPVGGKLYVANGGGPVNTSDKYVNLVIDGGVISTLVNGQTSGDKTYTGDVSVEIYDATVGNGGNSFLVNTVGVSNPWSHPDTIYGNIYVNVEDSVLGANATINVTDYVRLRGDSYVFNVSNSEVNSHIEVIGDSRVYTGTYDINFTDVKFNNKRMWLLEGDGDAAASANLNVNLTRVTMTGANYGVGLYNNDWNWGAPQGNYTIVYTIEDVSIDGYLHGVSNRTNADNVGAGNYGVKTIVVKGDNKVGTITLFDKMEIAATASVTGTTLSFGKNYATRDTGGTLTIDGAGYAGGTKVLIGMSTGIGGLDNIVVNDLADKYEVVKGTKAIVIADGVLGNLYYDQSFNSDITGTVSADGDILIYVGDTTNSNNANALNDLEKAKQNLAEPYKLYVAADGSTVFGTLEGADVTKYVNMVVTSGEFGDSDAKIAIADTENGKSVSGAATLEIAGGNYGSLSTKDLVDGEGNTVYDADGNAVQVIDVDSSAFATIDGSKGTGKGDLVLSKSGDMTVRIQNFANMTVTVPDAVTVHGFITVDALALDCEGTLTVDGTLDTNSITLVSDLYEGPSTVVLVAEGLTEEKINVTGVGDTFYLDKASNKLWLVSHDAGNVYIDASFSDATTGTEFNGDLLYFGVNAFNSMEEAAAVVAPNSDKYAVYILGGNFGDQILDLSAKGRVDVEIYGGNIKEIKLAGGDAENRSTVKINDGTVSAHSDVTIGSLTGADTVGFDLVAKEKASIDTITNSNEVNVPAIDSVKLNKSVGFVDGGALVVDLTEYAGGEGTVLSTANGFVNLVKDTTVISAVGNDAGYMLYATDKDIKAVLPGKSAYVSGTASTALNGKKISEVLPESGAGDDTVLVYGYNLSRGAAQADATAVAKFVQDDGTLFIEDGVYDHFYTAKGMHSVVINGGSFTGVNFGSNQTDSMTLSGKFDLTATGSTFGYATYFAGRGSDDGRTTIIVGDDDSTPGVWNFTFNNISTTMDGGAGEKFRLVNRARISGGVVNVTFNGGLLNADLNLFSSVENNGDQQLSEVNVVMNNVLGSASKWGWIWDPRTDGNTTHITLTIKNSEYQGNDQNLGLFGGLADNVTWKGNADVYISGFTMTGGRFTGGYANGGDDTAAPHIEGTRTLHVQKGEDETRTNTIHLVKEFTAIDIEDGAFLTADTISLPTGTAATAGFILRGTAEYNDGYKEYATATNAITTTGGAATAKYVDAAGNVIDNGYKAAVGSKAAFIYRADIGNVYVNSDYTSAITGTVVEDAGDIKNVLVFGDNAATTAAEAYAAAELRPNAKYIIDKLSTGTFYTNGHTTVLNGGNITTVYGGTSYVIVEGNPVAADPVGSVDITVNSEATVTNIIPGPHGNKQVQRLLLNKVQKPAHVNDQNQDGEDHADRTAALFLHRRLQVLWFQVREAAQQLQPQQRKKACHASSPPSSVSSRNSSSRLAPTSPERS